MGTEVKKSCCQFCHLTCGVLVHVEDGRITKVEPDPGDPVHKGMTCFRLGISQDVHYHPDRVNYPLKRVGEKGEGKWEKISWDQALNEIAAKIEKIKKKYGPEAVAGTKGTGRTDHWVWSRFFNLLGSPNYTSAGVICRTNAAVINVVTCGADTHPYIKLGKTKCIVIWGKNPTDSYPPIWADIRSAREGGAKLIVVDPRRTTAAEMADIWLQLRPATDTALAMGLINVIIEEELYDKDFVEKWCYGFDKLSERAKKYSPETVEKITWVPAHKIREAARMYAINKPAGIPWGLKPDQIGRNSTQAVRALAILRAITGNLDIEGGDTFGFSGDVLKALVDAQLEAYDALSQEQKKKQLGSDRWKLQSWPGYEIISKYLMKTPYVRLLSSYHHSNCHMPMIWRAILEGKPYPIKALIPHANNPILMAPNVKLVYRALKALDLLVIMEYFMTPTAMLADYVLPAADWMERPFINRLDLSRNYLKCGEAAVSPEYERQTDYYFYSQLGKRLGQYWPWETWEDAFTYQLQRLGYTFSEFVKHVRGVPGAPEFKKYEKHGFATPTGKVEIYSTILEELGYDPLPEYEEPAESPVSTPELAGDYPLMLITGVRPRYFYHTEHRQIEKMRSKHPDPLVQIHPETAKKYNINSGDWVWIETPMGKIKQRCQYFDGIHPEVVSAQHAWWFPERPPKEPELGGVFESNVNVLLNDEPDYYTDRMRVAWAYQGYLCRISKV